jgi:flagellar basal body rod protein FlgC
MSQISNIATQGLAFQATVLAQAAANIVNARMSVPVGGDGELLGALYAPQNVTGVSVHGGGVQARLVPVNPVSRLVYDSPSASGYAAVPNIDIATQLVTLSMAASSYKATASLFGVEADLSRTLIDALA